MFGKILNAARHLIHIDAACIREVLENKEYKRFFKYLNFSVQRNIAILYK
jgi:hypothetical protein